MKIAINLDVLYDFPRELKKFIRLNYSVYSDTLGKPLDTQKFWEVWEISERKYRSWVEAFILDGGFTRGLVVDRTAVETINKLRTAGHKVILFSDRHVKNTCKTKTIVDTATWLNDYVQYDDLLFIDDPSILEVDIFVDTSLSNLDRCNSPLPLCSDAPWNQDISNRDKSKVFYLERINALSIVISYVQYIEENAAQNQDPITKPK